MNIIDGLQIRKILDEVYKLQLDEIILSNKEAKEWLNKNTVKIDLTFGAEGGT